MIMLLTPEAENFMKFREISERILSLLTDVFCITTSAFFLIFCLGLELTAENMRFKF